MMNLKSFKLSFTAIRDWYIKFLLKYAWHVIISLGLISFSMSAISIVLYNDTFTVNPTVGFEARGTQLSMERLAVDNLVRNAASADEIRSVIDRTAPDSSQISVRNRRRAMNPTKNVAHSRLGDTDLDPNRSASEAGACGQYFILGTLIPHQYIAYLSKIILQVSSFNDLFTLPVMQKLCSIDTIIDEELHAANADKNIKLIPYSFNLPYYTMCPNFEKPSNSCGSLDSNDILMFRSMLMECHSKDPPIFCNTGIAQQLNNMIFERNADKVAQHSSFHIAVVLPVRITSQGANNIKFYDRLLRRLSAEFSGDERLRLVGAQFGVKNYIFEEYIRMDAQLGVIAILLVVLIVLVYTNSLFFTICIAFGLILSIGVAFFIYTMIFGIKFFPFLNLLAMILVVAVGADDAFLFMYQYRKHKDKASLKCSLIPQINLVSGNDGDTKHLSEFDDIKRKHVVAGLSDALSHAAIAMFVTSVTTAVAFFANLASSIMVLRCFGIYAGTMMLVNYIFVITVLPAAIIVTEVKHRKSCRTKKLVNPRRRIANIRRYMASGLNKVFAVYVPNIVNVIKLPMVVIGLAALIVSVYAIVKTPGIRLPEKNSMQFLRSNHPYEWYDENAASLFDFSNGDRLKMNTLVIWGIHPTTTASPLIPYDIGDLDLNDQFIGALANNLHNFERLLINVSVKCNPSTRMNLWLTKFIGWSQKSGTKQMCNISQNETSNEQSMISSKQLSECFLKFARIQPIVPFDENIYNDRDSPIFDKNGNLIGYYLVIRSVYNFSTIFNEMKPFFDSFHGIRDVIRQSSVLEFHKVLVLTSRLLTSLYDLLDRILNGTAKSVLISLLVSMVVIVFTTFQLMLSLIAIICIATVVTLTIATVLWFGWTINVVEATIIVLTIGMSFDYCLHFAVGFKLLGVNAFRSVASTVGVPVMLAAVSSFIAGFALIFARTQAFFEIGAFLMLMTTLSLTIAVFLFPSAVACLAMFYPKQTTRL